MYVSGSAVHTGIINTTLLLIFSHEPCIMNMCYVYKYVAVNIYCSYLPITDIIIQSLYNGNYIRLGIRDHHNRYKLNNNFSK